MDPIPEPNLNSCEFSYLGNRATENPKVLLGEPQKTQYDLNFGLLGFPIRVCPFFWVAALLLGQGAAASGVQYLLVWIAAVFLSILIHELGHAFAYRRYGMSSHIVLYHFGGLAIADGYGSAWGVTSRQRDPRSDIIISAAGPAAELLAALVLIVVLGGMGFSVPGIPSFLQRLLPFTNAVPLSSGELNAFVVFFIHVSIYWALMNLLPVYPLDGGQIARNLFMLYGGAQAVQQSLMLSVAAGAGICLWALTQQQTFLAIMFGILAYSSYQMLQAYGGRGGGFGSPW